MTIAQAGIMPFPFIVDFNEARRRLVSLRLRPYGTMHDGLSDLWSRIKFARTLAETGLRDDRRLLDLNVDQFSKTYFEKLTDIIAEQFPIEYEMMFRKLYEGDGEIYLIPEPMGMNRLADMEVAEGFDDPESYFSSEADQVRVFFMLLNVGYGEEEWENCNAFFNWDMPVAPPWSNDTYLNDEMFEEKMRKAGYETLYQCLPVVWGSDNQFFGLYPYSENLQDYPEFNKENMDLFKEQWEEAKKILEFENQAIALCDKDRSIFQRAAYIWLSSLEKR